MTETVSKMRNIYGMVPHLAIIQVGDREDSSVYVRMKQNAAIKVCLTALLFKAGINFSLKKMPVSISQSQVKRIFVNIKLIDEISTLNSDSNVHGILVQLPLPDGFDERQVTESIDVQKDVDGFHSINIGQLAKRDTEPLFLPCTPKGIMELLKSISYDLKGKRAVVVGRSNIVGMPIAHLLQSRDATVTVCHSKTINIENIVKDADVLVVAIGKPNMIQGDWLKPGVVVIDVGTNAVPDSSKKSGVRWVGDVDFESATKIASHITPVPGGVGPMTVAMLLDNTIISAQRFIKGYKIPTSYSPLNILNPVPRYFRFAINVKVILILPWRTNQSPLVPLLMSWVFPKPKLSFMETIRRK